MAQVARDILVEVYRRQLVRAWIVPRAEATPERLARTDVLCTFLLEVLDDRPTGELVVAMLYGEAESGHTGRPVAQNYLRTQMRILPGLLEHVAVLDGSPRPWQITRAWFDARSSRMVLTLRILPPVDPHRPAPELVVLAGPEEGFFCFVRDPLGRRCRITTIKPGEMDAKVAADRWLDRAAAEQQMPDPPRYQWIPDPAYPGMHVCVRRDVLGAEEPPVLE
ncbi:MAG: hypothetical protein KC619_09250 [Myxococcales bacterium]|nr:hypothetical protein [Myxococcales bacterium]